MDLNRKKKEHDKDANKVVAVVTEPVAVNLRKDELMNRLYDQGFSHYTMASISRPITNNSHSKPLSSKLYSLKNSLTKEKTQKQHSILFNVPEQSYLNPDEELKVKSKHSAFIHTTSAFYKSQPKAIEGGFPHIGRDAIDVKDHGQAVSEMGRSGGLIGMNKTTTSKFSAFPKLAPTPPQANNRLLTPMTQGFQGTDRRTAERTMTAFDQTGVQFHPGPGHAFTQQPISTTAQSFFKAEDQRDIQHPDHLSEMKNSRLVVDKLRGKVDQDKDRTSRKLKSIEDCYKEAADLAKKEETKRQAELQAMLEESKKEVKETTNLDMYLGLILKNNANIDEFMYARPDPKSDNPYKLELVKYEKDKESYPESYTVSGKGLCHYKNNQPVEFIPLKDWLDERETFKKIQSLQFFQKFRKWKTLKRWRKACQQFKRRRRTTELSERLFINNESLRNSLLRHREYCYNMSLMKFINLNPPADSTEAMPLQHFIDLQHQERQKVKRNIGDFSEMSRKTVRDGFDSCLKELKDMFKKDSNKTAVGGNRATKGMQKVIEEGYEELGFGKDMSYDQRSKVRNACMNFLRFAFLLDFIALDALTKIYVQSVNDLKEKLRFLAYQEGEKKLTDLEKARTAIGGKVPMFEVEVIFNPISITTEVEFQKLAFFDMPERLDAAASDFANFNISAHPFLIDFTQFDDKIQCRQVQEFDTERLFDRPYVRNIVSYWLAIEPTSKSFQNDLGKILTEGLAQLQAFERWSNHEEMRKYSRVLEDWDDQMGKENDGMSSNYLNPEEWLRDEERHTVQQGDIDSIIDHAFFRTNNYLQSFEEFLRMYWDYENIDFQMLMSEELAKPRITFKSIFMVLDYHINYLEASVPFQADIGLFRINSLKLKQVFKPKLEDVKTQLEILLPKELRRRSDILINWIRNCYSKMETQEGDDENIQNFIKQRRFLQETEAELPYYKERIKTVEELYKILKDFHIEHHKDDLQLFTDIKNKDNSIGSDIMSKNDANTKQQEVLSKKLRNTLIPALMTEARKLNEESMQAKFLDEENWPKHKEIIDELQSLSHKLDKIREQERAYTAYEKEFNMADLTDFDYIRQLEQDIRARKVLWESLKEWETLTSEWNASILSQIDYKDIERKADKYYSNVKLCKKSIPPDNPLIRRLESDIKKFSKTMPIVLSLNCKDLKTDDVQKIKNLIGLDSSSFQELTLNQLIDMKVFNYQNEIVKIAKQAEEETKLDIIIDEVNKLKGEIQLPTENKNSSNPAQAQKEAVTLLGDSQKIQQLNTQLETVWGKINFVFNNRYLEKKKVQVANTRNDIMDAMKLVDEWLKFQSMYVYLETIFSNPDFKKELSEFKREVQETQDRKEAQAKNDVQNFEQVNNKYKKLSREVVKDFQKGIPRSLHKTKKYIADFKEINEKITIINRNINEFLDKKRNEIYRLHFISNDEMIVLLANADKVETVQQFIAKLFENVNKLQFNARDNEHAFDAVIAREGEVLRFGEFYAIKEREKAEQASRGAHAVINIAEKPIKIWLEDLEKQVTETLVKQVDYAIKDIVDQDIRDEFYLNHNAQAISLVNQYYWTMNTAMSIGDSEQDPEAMWNWYKEIIGNIGRLTQLVRSGLKGYRHTIICSVVTSEVHNRDVVMDLYEKGVTQIDDFAWEQQLRYETENSPTL